MTHSDPSSYRDDECVLITDPDTGQLKRWVKVSARLRRFMATFPPGQFRVRVIPLSREQMWGSLVRLYEAAIQYGRKPADYGLPVTRWNELRVIARLEDAQGNILLEESALGTVESYKDQEKIATAALQRLVALAGFAGDDVFDDDERRDIASVTASRSPVPAKGPPPVVVAAPAAIAAETVSTAPAADVDTLAEDTLTSADEASQDAAPPVQEPPGPSQAASATAAQPQSTGGRQAHAPPAQAPTWTGAPAAGAAPVDRSANRLESRRAAVQEAYRARGMEPPEIATMADCNKAMRAIQAARLGAGGHA